MANFQVETHSSQILSLINEAAHWIVDADEHFRWAGTELAYRERICSFPIGSAPLEVCTLRVEDQLVAYLEVHHNQFGWVIARVLVHPDHRRKGYAQQLIKLTLPRVFSHAASVSLFLAFENLAARGLYEKFGFVQIESYPDDGVDRFLLFRDQYFLTSLTKIAMTAMPKKKGSKLLSSLISRVN